MKLSNRHINSVGGLGGSLSLARMGYLIRIQADLGHMDLGWILIENRTSVGILMLLLLILLVLLRNM
jgi:hypothetical protein